MTILSNEDIKRFLKEGVFPYNRWFATIDKLDCTTLPLKDDFGSDLSDEDLSKRREYGHDMGARCS
jgi:hypothetical protein